MLILSFSVFGAIIGLIILWLIREDYLSGSSSVVWLPVSLAFFLAGLIPYLTDKLASEVGVAYPPTLALSACVVILVLKILHMDVENCSQRLRSVSALQEIAVLEFELSQLQLQVHELQKSNQSRRT